MQRKGNKPKIYSNISNKLHSIPKLKKNVKSNVVYSIPSVCMLAFLIVFSLNLLFSTESYAYDSCPEDIDVCPAALSDRGTINTQITSSGTATPPTISLYLNTPKMVSDTATPGNSAEVSTDVQVKVANADSYTLTLNVNSTTMTSGSTTISAGNVIADNTWGYKWDNATTYTAPSTTGQNLAVPALISGAADFTKTLTFGVKFANDADAGHYTASGTLSLVATPKAATYTLDDLTQMQQLSLPGVTDACANTPYVEDKVYNLIDVRDNSSYTVSKFKDGKCWMTQNLKLSSMDGSTNYSLGRKLIPTTTDITEEWTLPASNLSNFNTTQTTQATYLGADDKGVATGYYTWCAATAGTCSSATSTGAHAPSSICPKGWRLPTGGTSGNTDFYSLFKNMGLTISGSLAMSGTTNWGAGDLSKVQSSPYNFNYTGRVYSESYDTPASYQGGYWWSSTAQSALLAYDMYMNNSYVYPGTYSMYYDRYGGFAVRCVAQ